MAIKKKLLTYSATHTHRHGTDTYFFQTDKVIGTLSKKDREKLIKAFNIDFEENRIDEYIEVDVITKKTIKLIEL